MMSTSSNCTNLPSSLLVTGLVRNCAHSIRADIQRVQSAVQGLGRLRWLLIESDSDDGSVDELNKLAEEQSDFKFISLGELRSSKPFRTDRLAFCRNVYLAELHENPAYLDVDFLLVADFDGINTLLTPAAMRSCWHRNGWDVCAANQAGPYYDIWALRHPEWSPNDCWANVRFLRRYGASAEDAGRAGLYSRMITIPQDSSWIQVDSAFGGLAVYRRSALGGLHYVGLDDNGDEVCEHVALHRQMVAQGAKLFINPRLINASYTEHTVHLLKRRRFMRLVKSPFLWVHRKLRERFSMGPKHD
jgi:hypothetical protein